MQPQANTTQRDASEAPAQITTSIRVPEELWDRAKHIAIDAKCELRDIVIAGVEREVRRLEKLHGQAA